MSWILGLKGGAGWHNSAVCLLDSDQDGIAFAAEEERYNNIVQTSQFPLGAISDALSHAGISQNEIDHVGYPMSTQEFRDHGDQKTFDALSRVQQVLGTMFPNANVLMLDHHLCHAASTYFCSPFDHAAVLTIDGVGESTTTAFYHAGGNEIELLDRIELPHSLGQVYTLICMYLGFKGLNPEGKMMGLAPYGEPRYLDLFRELIVTAGIGFRLDMNRFVVGMPDQWPVLLPKEVLRRMGLPSKVDAGVTQNDMDVAASLQARLEEVCLHMAHELHRKTGEPDLCLAGGVALNSVTNKRLLDETPFRRLFVQPAANDGGTPLGAALLIKHGILGKPRQETLWTTPYLGADYSSDGIRAFLDKRGVTYHRPPDLIDRVAQDLAAGRIVGWFCGRAELGPRALGNRSILCAPRPAEVRDVLNDRVKHREWFRPYAPAVLAARAAEYFDLDCESPYMLLVARVREDKHEEIAAVTHVDGTARVQTVRREQNPAFYDLIQRFGELTGTPVLLNTSFNVRREAIVCTPEDALDCFLFTELDELVLEDLLMLKQENLTLRQDLTHDQYLQRRRRRYVDACGERLTWFDIQLAL